MRSIVLAITLSVALAAVAAPIVWDAKQARENASATVKLITSAQKELATGDNVAAKARLKTLDRMEAGFKGQLAVKNSPSVNYEICLDALQSFKPYATEALKGKAEWRTEYLREAKNIYSDDLRRCNGIVGAKS